MDEQLIIINFTWPHLFWYILHGLICFGIFYMASSVLVYFKYIGMDEQLIIIHLFWYVSVHYLKN